MSRELPLAGPAWVAADGLTGLRPDSLTALALAGRSLLVANVGGTLLAYENACAGCGCPLEAGSLQGGMLTCPSCSRRFALPLAGRAVGPEPLQLRPVPLLAENGVVRVAVAA
jgi:nitrite reductase/ring-hydroxylating ferredoxin subunit